MRFLNALPFLTLLPGIQAQTKLPDAPGREAFKKVCSVCHELETATASRRTKAGWERMIDDMIDRGAEGSAQEMEAILTYLTSAFGKVNVNTASAAELQKTLDLSSKEAQAILTYREKNGSYKTFEDLLKAPGIRSDKLQEKRDRIAFSQ